MLNTTFQKIPLRAIFLLQILLVLSLTSSSSMHGTPQHKFLVQLEKNVTLEQVQHNWHESQQLNQLKPSWKLLSKRINAYRLTFSTSIESVTAYRTYIQSLEGVQHIKKEQSLTFRSTIPNDERYTEQFYLPLIEAQEAWDQTTGGVTVQGDTIVIAILDSGFDIDHRDLDGNVWINHQEIPENGLDDDANGYVDDYYGYNFADNTNEHPIRSHGTAVAGLAGAKGDNAEGITGVNWHVKMMFLTIRTEGDVIEAYEYVLDQDSLYQESEGQEGAYVVVTNLSAGIENAWPEDFPMWCEMYDELLDRGILSACAAPNLGVNIDEEGDIPGTCPSEGTVIVTNTDQNDVKLNSAGYGAINVDLSAPGEDIFTLTTDDGYDSATGTSFSTPIVAGAIALLHSADCENFTQFSKSQPRAAALALKDIMLRTVDPAPTLNNISVAEGRLNIKNAMLELAEERCGAESGPVMISKFGPSPASDKITFNYQVPDYRRVEWSIYDVQGRQVLSGQIDPPAFDVKEEEISVLNLSQGMYFLEFIHPDQREVRRFVVQQ